MSREEFRFTCELHNGLHARPASHMVRYTQACEADIKVLNSRNGREANGKSVLSLIAADITYQDVCTIVLDGMDARQTLERIRYFVLHELSACDEVLPEVAEITLLAPSLRSLDMDYCRGQVAGEGWARGVPVVLKEYRFLPVEDHPVYAGVTGERLRLIGALEQVRQDLRETIDEVEHVAEREVLKAHLALAGDPDFKLRLLEHVDNGLSVVESIEATMEHFSQVLESGESCYLRDRVIDIRDLCDQILRLSYGSGKLCSPDNLVKNSICLADNLTPSQFLALDKRYLEGLVLQSGGKASHTVLLARARGIPVVVGAEGARELMERGGDLILDAAQGLLIANPTEKVIRYYQQEKNKQQLLQDRCKPFIENKAMTRDGVRIEVAANIVGLDDAGIAFANGAEGIGLFRTEMMFMERNQAPDEDEQYAHYRGVLNEANGRPVIIRTIDVGADKPIDYFELDEEQNPFLGYRAVRLYPQYLDYFKIQLRAILRASFHGPVKIMVPMVTTVDEIQWVRKVLTEVEDELSCLGVAFGAVQLGIMLEVPACSFIIDHFSKYVDFYSLGTNDLAQYFMAADRGNNRVGSLYSYLHPSFLRMLDMIVKDAQKHGKWIGICGEMAADPDVLPLLVGLGVDEISLPGGVIPGIKEKMSHLESVSCRQLLEQSMSCENIQVVERLLQKQCAEQSSRPILHNNIVKMDFDALSKEEVIKELVDLLYLDGRLADSRAVEQEIWERETVCSTGLGYGIAIPHCQSDDVYSDSIGIIRLKTPLNWLAIDGHAVNTVFLLAVRKSEAQENHMKVFASLARKLVNMTFLTEVDKCTTSEQLVHLLQRELCSVIQ